MRALHVNESSLASLLKHLDGLPFILWSISFYPQVFLDFKRMHFLSSSDPISLFFLFSAQFRVVGLDLDEAFLSVLDRYISTLLFILVMPNLRVLNSALLEFVCLLVNAALVHVHGKRCITSSQFFKGKLDFVFFIMDFVVLNVAH